MFELFLVFAIFAALYFGYKEYLIRKMAGTHVKADRAVSLHLGEVQYTSNKVKKRSIPLTGKKI